MKITEPNYAQQTELERDCLCAVRRRLGDGGKLQRRRAVVSFYYTLKCLCLTRLRGNALMTEWKCMSKQSVGCDRNVFKCQKANRLQNIEAPSVMIYINTKNLHNDTAKNWYYPQEILYPIDFYYTVYKK